MKKTYKAPVAKKVDYVFEDQIVAGSVPVQGHTDWYQTDIVCTWGPNTFNCNKIYNEPVMVRSLDQCSMQGDIPLNTNP